jgi:hypothetical protein
VGRIQKLLPCRRQDQFRRVPRLHRCVRAAATSPHEDTLEQTCPNYWSRRLLLDKFDDWKDGWRKDYPWYWGFEEIKEKRHGKIRTPEQFIRTFTACVKFVAAEYEKDPKYQPPEALSVDTAVKRETLASKMRRLLSKTFESLLKLFR